MIYYAYVQRPGEPLFRQPILAFQKKKRVIGDTEIPEEAGLLQPDSNGIIGVDEKHEYIKMIRGSIEKVMEKLNKPGQAKRMIGPFEDDDPAKVKENPLTGYQKALLGACQERPKTAEEQVAIKDAEIAELRKKLAEKKPDDGK
jgi:hypothetical protein